MRIVAIDFETTGTDPQTCDVIEVGAVLWDTEEGLIGCYSELVCCADPPVVPDEVVSLTGITGHVLEVFGVARPVAESRLRQFSEEAEMILGHNWHEFDGVIAARLFGSLPRLPVIDTTTDLSDAVRTRQLTHLAAEHGFLNPFPHRALFDAMTCLKVFSMYPLDVVLERAKSPTITVRANVSYADRELAKARRYYWDGDQKLWLKRIKELDLAGEREAAGFPVEKVA